MKYTLILTLFLGLSISSMAQTKAITQTGKTVLLFDDGTWKYEHAEQNISSVATEENTDIVHAPLVNDTIIATSSKLDIFSEVSPRLKKFFGAEKSKINCTAEWHNDMGKVSLKLVFLVPIGDANRYFGHTLQDCLITLHYTNNEHSTFTISKDITQKFIEKWNVSYYEGAFSLDEEQINKLLKHPNVKMTVNWKKRTEEYEIKNSTILKKGLIEVL